MKRKAEEDPAEQPATKVAKEDDDDSKYIVKMPNGAIKTTNIKCQAKCGFFGGLSGYCSVCWKKLDATQQADATALQMTLEPARARAAEQEALEEARKKQEAAEQARKDLQERQAGFEKERNDLREQNKCYPIYKSVKDYKSDGSEEAESFSSIFSMMDSSNSNVEMWSCGIYNNKIGTPATHADPSAEYLNNWRNLQGQLRSEFTGIEIVSEGDYGFTPFCIPTQGFTDLESGTCEEKIRKVLELPGEDATYPFVSDSDTGFFENYINKKAQFRKAMSAVRSLAKDVCIFHPAMNESDCCVGPILIAGIEKDTNILFVVASYIVWT